MAKIQKMTKKAVIEALAEQNISVNLAIETKDKAPVKEPGTIGICETKNGNLMVYMVNDQGKLYNTSVHTDRKVANGRVYQRALALQA